MKGGRTSDLVQQVKAKMSDEEKDRHDSEYQELLALFIGLLKMHGYEAEEEALYELMDKRTDFAIRHALRGLGVDYEKAIQLLENHDDNNLTQQDLDLRARIEAAVENLIDFSVCEEYQLYEEAIELIGDGEIDFGSSEFDELVAICSKYNDAYAAVENADIMYAGIMAAWWIKQSAADYIVYWTQNDAKVRPWHMALQGYAAPRDEFPSWMIPPIEYNCRCFLQTLDYFEGYAKMKGIRAAVKVRKPKQLGNVFDESLAKCGRIFGPSHPYFSVKGKDKEMLNGFVLRLRKKYGTD